ncbi:MAG TPA: DUF3617 family protein [Burkholderiaceae bacterium]|nr:DUF3617 family protein [Burkholderiaceae bacterium]
MKRRTQNLFLLASATALMSSLPSRADESGDRWRVTSSMSMGTMVMPSQTAEVCAARRPDAAPIKTDSNCQITENQHVGNKQTMKMHCGGAHPGDGTLEIVFDRPDHYHGQMVMTSQQGQMTMHMEGDKLAGQCDPTATKQQAQAMAAQARAQSVQNTKEACASSVKGLETSAFVGPLAACKDSESVRAYCEHVTTVEGFSTLSSREKSDATAPNMPAEMRDSMFHPLAASAKLCSFDVSQMRSKLCAGADGRSQAAFVVDQCPTQARALAQRECSGREQSTITLSPWGEFCGRYAAQQARTSPTATATSGQVTNSPAPAPAQQGASNTPQPPNNPSGVDQAKDAASSAINKGTSLIKGLFSH